MSNPFDIIDARLSNIEALLLDIKHSPKDKNSTEQSGQWFDIAGLCCYLPGRFTKKDICAHLQNKTIPFHKKDRKILFLRSEIDTWLIQSDQVTTKGTLTAKYKEASYG